MSRKGTMQQNLNSDLDFFDEKADQLQKGEEILRIPKHEIYSDPQVRQTFNEEKIQGLSASMEEHGQIQPIIVNHRDSKGYCIQKGENRWRGAMINPNITHVDCIVRDKGTVWEQLAENIHRDDLSPFEIGAGLRQGMKEFGLTENKQVAEKMGLSTARVSAFLKTTECPQFIRDAYDAGKIGDVDTINSMRIAASIDEDKTKSALDESEIVSRKEAQELTKSLKSAKTEPSETPEPEKAPEPPRPVKQKARVQHVRVKVDGQYGVIDLKGKADDGEIVVLLDDSPGSMTVPVDEVELVGYQVKHG